ncbi:MAG TPA: ABC transporter ATP-binding protein [bacterium]|nr:ABC transporter ATP-binding protein [bacterium]
MSATVLSVESVSLHFGGISALSDLSLTLQAGELAGVIGPNGAGKTSLFNILSGVYQPSAGNVRVLDRSLADLNPNAVAALGLVRTFQNIRLFKELTVLDNVRLALHGRQSPGLLDSLLRRPSALAAEAGISRQAEHLLERLELAERGQERAGDLAYGDQKKLEIARALAAGPKILLLDEPAAGMNPAESAWLKSAISAIRRDFNLSVLLIEHDMSVVMGFANGWW